MKRDILSGAFFVAFGAALLLAIIPLGVADSGGAQNLAMSPSFWPKALAYSLIFLGGVMVFRTIYIYFAHYGGKNPAQECSIGKIPSSKINYSGVIALTALPIYYLSTLWIGLIIPSVLAFIIYSLCYSSKSIASSIFWGITITSLLTLFFIKAASIVIPLGPIGAIIY